MTILPAATTRHRHTESLGGILTTSIIGRNYRELERAEKFEQGNDKQANMTLQVIASKQSAFNWITRCPCWMSGATPSQATKKPLASIVSILNLPKFRLATFYVNLQTLYLSLSLRPDASS